MVRRPVPWLVSLAFAVVKLWAEYRRKINPSTGTLYSDDFNLELARSSSAAPHRRFSSSVVLAGIDLAHRLPEFQFESLAVPLDHLDKERRHRRPTAPSPGTLESDPVQQLPQV